MVSVGLHCESVKTYTAIAVDAWLEHVSPKDNLHF